MGLKLSPIATRNTAVRVGCPATVMCCSIRLVCQIIRDSHKKRSRSFLRRGNLLQNEDPVAVQVSLRSVFVFRTFLVSLTLNMLFHCSRTLLSLSFLARSAISQSYGPHYAGPLDLRACTLLHDQNPSKTYLPSDTGFVPVVNGR